MIGFNFNTGFIVGREAHNNRIKLGREPLFNWAVGPYNMDP